MKIDTLLDIYNNLKFSTLEPLASAAAEGEKDLLSHLWPLANFWMLAAQTPMPLAALVFFPLASLEEEIGCTT